MEKYIINIYIYMNGLNLLLILSLESQIQIVQHICLKFFFSSFFHSSKIVVSLSSGNLRTKIS